MYNYIFSTIKRAYVIEQPGNRKTFSNKIALVQERILELFQCDPSSGLHVFLLGIFFLLVGLNLVFTNEEIHGKN